MNVKLKNAIEALREEARIDYAREQRLIDRYYRLMWKHNTLSHEELMVLAVASIKVKTNKYERRA